MMEDMVKQGQDALKALKFAPFPVVGAPSGMALGGGCESLLHCDAVQAIGKVAIDVKSLGAHLVTLSSHKIGGPAGSGALINTGGVSLEPTFLGGGQEKKVRSGTGTLSHRPYGAGL